jgi:hypothetical protein
MVNKTQGRRLVLCWLLGVSGFVFCFSCLSFGYQAGDTKHLSDRGVCSRCAMLSYLNRNRYFIL